jgi:hypothetical protein
MRKIDECRICGETREIWALGLCVNCYRNLERQAKADRSVDRHSSPIRREHQRLFAGYSQAMIAFGKIGLGRKEIEAVVAVMRPFLEPIAHYLRDSGAESPCERNVAMFTVHNEGDLAEGKGA